MINIVTELERQQLLQQLFKTINNYDSMLQLAEIFPDEPIPLERLNITRALYFCCGLGDISVLKWLVKNNPNLLITKETSSIALTSVCSNEHLHMLKYLVEQGIDIHIDNEAALITSCSVGHLESVKYLVELGANVKAKKSKALKVAIESNHKDVVEYLIEKGAKIYEKRSKQ